MSNPYQDFQDDRFNDDDGFDSYDATDEAGIEYQTFGRQRQNKPWYWIVGCGCLAMMVLCCGICSGLAYFGLDQLQAEVQTELQNNPVVKEHIGEIQKVEMQWVETFENGDDDVYVMRLIGEKASGKVTVKLKDVGIDEHEEIESGTLVLDNGDEFELVPDEKADFN